MSQLSFDESIANIKKLLKEDVEYFLKEDVIEIAQNGIKKLVQLVFSACTLWQELYCIWWEAKIEAINTGNVDLNDITTDKEKVVISVANTINKIRNELATKLNLPLPNFLAIIIQNQYGEVPEWLSEGQVIEGFNQNKYKNNRIGFSWTIPIAIGIVCSAYLLGYIIELIADAISTCEYNKQVMIASIYKIDPELIKQTKVKDFTIDIVSEPVKALSSIGTSIGKSIGTIAPIAIGALALFYIVKKR